MKNESKLRWSDVWLLTAIFYANRDKKASLPDIIAVADCINHSVINFEELASGLARLKQHGLIVVDSSLKDLRCSESAAKDIESNIGRFKNAYDVRKWLEKELQAISWKPNEPLPHPENNLDFPGVDKKLYSESIDEYLKNIKSTERLNIDTVGEHRITGDDF